MSIIVKSFQKYATIPDFLLKFQEEVKVRLTETLSTDSRTTIADTVLRYISAQFWPQQDASVYISLPEIEVVNPDEQRIIEAVRQHIQVSDKSTYNNACTQCYKEISPAIVTSIAVALVLSLSFMFARFYKLGLFQLIKTWIIIGAIGFFVYMAFYVQSVTRAIYLLILSTPVYGIIILFLMQKDVRAPDSPFRRQAVRSRLSHLKDNIFSSSPIQMGRRLPNIQLRSEPLQVPVYGERETLEDVLNDRNIN